MKVLIVVDYQNDFVSGTLGSKQAQAVQEQIIAKVKSFPGKVIATRDTHQADYLTTQEGRKLPVEHCLKDSWGWQLVAGLDQLIKEKIDKESFGSYRLPELINPDKEDLESIELIGVCTGICVLSNALILKAYYPEVPIIVDASCCACVSEQSHQTALAALKLSQVEVINEN